MKNLVRQSVKQGSCEKYNRDFKTKKSFDDVRKLQLSHHNRNKISYVSP